MKFTPGCSCCVSCSAIPEQLYIASNLWAGKQSFAYDSGSGLWLAGVMATGIVVDPASGCTGATVTGQTAMIYQMNTSGILFRIVEAINSLPFPSTFCKKNTMPGNLAAFSPFGPLYNSASPICVPGSARQGGASVACTCCPLQLTRNLVNPPSFGSETVTITDTP